MEIRSIKDCFRERLLRKIKPDSEKSKKSLELAEKELNEVKYLISSNKAPLFKFAIISSYMAMFHAARSLLYRDGIQEKNHYAIYIYLKERYKQSIPFSVLNLLNVHRAERHEAMYGLDYKTDKEDAQIALEDAKSFVKEIKNLLGKNKNEIQNTRRFQI